MLSRCLALPCIGVLPVSIVRSLETFKFSPAPYLCVSVRDAARAKDGLRGRLVSTAAQRQPKQTAVHWHGEQGSVCVFNSVRVCVQPLSCSKNNPLLRIFNPQVTALSSLLFLALYRTLTHLMCILYTQLHTHTHICRGGVGGGVGSPGVKPVKTLA